MSTGENRPQVVDTETGELVDAALATGLSGIMHGVDGSKEQFRTTLSELITSDVEDEEDACPVITEKQADELQRELGRIAQIIDPIPEGLVRRIQETIADMQAQKGTR